MKIKRKPKPTPAVEDEKPPRRAITDSIVETVHYAKDKPGKWIRLARDFKTRENAHSTASCVRRGFLRVRPKDGEPTFVLAEHTYLALPAKPEVKVDHDGGVWRLSVRIL
ncbi:MAG TPA: hypothetical protein VHY83_15160 [Solirubrobacteraceae bacterium]|nr:hypothetical protein [Solirubrobacteraceae bacterium]